MAKSSPRGPARRPRPARRPPAVERLEDRTLPSLVAPLTGFNPALPPSASAGGVSQALTSADGRFIVYTSTAANLAPGQVNTAVASNIFLYDRQTGTTTLVSHTPGSATTGADGNSDAPRISSDGHLVVYESTASDLVTGQAGPRGQENVFLYDATTGATTLVSHRSGSAATAADASSMTSFTTGFGSGASVSNPSGQFLLFSSSATDLVSSQGGPTALNLFLYNTGSGAITLVSHNFASLQIGADDATEQADLTPDGSAVVFESFATDVVPGQTGNKNNVFLYLTGSGTSQLVSGAFDSVGGHNSLTNAAGFSFQPLINASGGIVTYVSDATDLVAGQTAAGGTATRNVFVYDTTVGATALVSGSGGSPSVTANGNSTEAALSSDGSTVAFLSDATDLVAGQGPNAGNVFLYDTSSRALTLASHVSGAPTTAAGGVATSPTGTFADLSLSADGRFLTYESTAPNLAAGQPGPFGVDNVFLYDGQSGQSTLVSQAPGPGAAGDRNSFYARVSADGSAVAFLSLATDLAAGVADGGQNLYVYGVTGGAGPALASTSAFQATATSLVYGTSADGRFVLFTSNAADVVPGQADANSDQDVFLLDRDTGGITLVSHVPGSPTTTGDHGSPDLLAGVSPVLAPAVSADGNWVVFVSEATNLVAGESGETNADQVYVFNRLTGAVALVSHDFASTMAVGNADAVSPVISADGRFIAYASHSSDLVPGLVEPDPSILVDNVYLYDTATGQNTLLSHAAGSPQVGGENASFAPAISDDGRFIAYQSESTTLVAGGSVAPTDNIYLFDNSTGNPTSGQNVLVSHVAGNPTTSPAAGSTGPVISADGSTVAFVSHATDLVPGQQPTPFTNVFLYHVAGGGITLASGTNGSTTSPADGDSDSPALSADGSVVAVRSDAPNLVAGQVNTPGTTSNVFLFCPQTGTMTLVSHDANSPLTTAAGNSSAPAFDGAGDLVVYLSTATDLVPGQQGGGVNNVFLYAVPLGANALLSGQGGSPVVAGSNPAFQAVISRDPVVAFNVLSGGGGVAFLNRLIELVLSSTTVADGSPPGTVVGTLSISTPLVGQFSPPVYTLPGGEADNASFGLGAAAAGQVPLLIEVPANAATRASYQVSLHVTLLGSDVTLFTVTVGPPGAGGGGGITARLVAVTVRRKRRLRVEVFSAATGALSSEFLSPFQKPAFKKIQVSVIDSNGDGVPDEVVVTARKGRRRVTRTFPA